jgi:hypothetical protein
MWETIQDAIDHMSQSRIAFEAEHEKIDMSDEELAIYTCAVHGRQDLLNQCRWVVIEQMIKDGLLREGKYGIFAIIPDEVAG